MPIYEYHCNECQKEFEELVFGNETPSCPDCGAKKAERLLSRPCLHMPGPSRVGQTVSYPSSGSGGCSGCSASSCAGCK